MYSIVVSVRPKEKDLQLWINLKRSACRDDIEAVVVWKRMAGYRILL
jgi:hypothetical protein